MSGSAQIVVSSDALGSVIHDSFAGLGLPAEDARAIADVLVDANLRGLDSHGLHRVPTYMRRVREGLAGGSDRMSVEAEFGPLRRLDARQALGPAGAMKAIDMAIDLTRRYGIGLVALGNSTHFGAAGFYVRRAAKQGLIALVTTNATKTMVPYGAAEPFLGANVMAIGAPLGRHGEFCLDMAATVVARGKIRRAAEQGIELEPGLAVDADGKPTTDPVAAYAGNLLPLGGPKGTGIALALNLLAGMLAGADFDHELTAMHSDDQRPQNVGQVFLVMDPARLGDPEASRRRVEQLIDDLHSLRPADGFDRVLYAGERGTMVANERLEHGIPVAAAEIDALHRACLDAGLSAVAERVARLRGSGRRASAPAGRPRGASRPKSSAVGAPI